MRPIYFPKWYLKYAHHMLGWLVVLGLVASQCSCAAAKIAALSTVAAVASARGDTAGIMVKLDHSKQVELRKAIFVADQNTLQKLEKDFQSYTQDRDRALLGLSAMGEALSAATKSIAAGKFDLSLLLTLYADVRNLVSKLNITLPVIPGGSL